MEVLSSVTYLDNWKRYWRRRKYQRLNDTSNNRKKMKIARLGSKIHRGLKLRLRLAPRLIISPTKQYLTKFYDACITHTIVALVGRTKRIGCISRSGHKTDRPFPMISSTTNEVVDGRLILETYKRMLASRQLPSVLI